MTEKIKAKEKALEERKKKSMKAWSKKEIETTYGASYSVRFAIKKLWQGGCSQRLLFLLNLVLIITMKLADAMTPLILMSVINSIICTEDKAVATGKSCPTSEETISLIWIYSIVRFSVSVLGTIRDIPF